MKSLSISLLLILLIDYFSQAHGSRILFLAPIGSKSHKIFFMGIVEELAKRGHHITMVTSYEPAKEIKNVREVVIDFNLDSMLSNVFEDSDTVNVLFNECPTLCSDTLAQEQVQALKNEQFDVIIISMFFDYCYLSFVHHFKVPFIYISPGGLFGPFSELINHIEFPSISGSVLMEPEFPVSFTTRLKTTASNFMLMNLFRRHMESRTYSICVERGLCPKGMPYFTEINHNVSLAIINSVRSLEWPPRPSMPNLVYAGGAHIKPAKDLPKELEEWVQGSGEDGFIFFSIGSALKPSFLPEKYRKILVNVFGSLKQRVLWKWDEENMPDLPKNVKLSKWLPQADILGHPKLRLFITHGGLLSTLESTYNGIPIIGMPVFADQFSNMISVEKEGWGRVMNWKTLEENAFRSLLLDVLNNEKMKEISKRRSEIMKDSPIPPAKEAAYWVEYVIKHKGAPHIMSPLKFMKWYEVYNIDVWAFIIGVLLGLIYLIWRLLKFLFRKCCGGTKSSKGKTKKE